MKRLLFWIITPLLFLTVNLLPSELAGAHSMQAAPNLSALEVIAEVNALRASSNLPPYQVDAILMTIAQKHADYLADTGVITHFDAEGKPPFQRAIDAGYSVAGDISQGGDFSEVIESGSGLSAAEVVALWKGEAENLKVMISHDMQDVGVGMTVANGVTYYVLDAGSSIEGATTPSSTVTSGTPSALVIINTPLADGTIYHQVQKDEGLWSIALAYDITIEQLKLLNGLATDEIFIGQKLIIKRPEIKTATVEAEVLTTATFGIPTSTSTKPVTPTEIITFTAAPVPVAPASRQSGGMVVGVIVMIALLAAGMGSWLGRKKSEPPIESND